MTPADRVARARDLIREAQAELHAASFALRASRSELLAELAVLERSRDRLAVVRARILSKGWLRFVALVRRQEER